MTQRESDEQRKVTRRVFIQYTAAASAAAAGASGMSLKTDALAQQNTAFIIIDDGTMSYPYQ
jgi:hypothetical protein